VLSNDQILDWAWRTQFVGESALTRNMAELRQQLGDRARPGRNSPASRAPWLASRRRRTFTRAFAPGAC